MDIELFEFQPARVSETTGVVGFHIGGNATKPHVNLFSIAENHGALIRDNLWTVATAISRQVLNLKTPDNIDWTLSSNFKTTRVKFQSLHGSPMQIDLSDRMALDMERHVERYSVDRYRKEYAGHPPINVDEGRIKERVPDPIPISVFTVPCTNPAANDGVMHCVPSYYNSAHMRDGFDYILADTRKLIGGLKRSDPAMLQHAVHKYWGDTPEGWLEHRSVTMPLDMGFWAKTQDNSGLTMSAGMAGMIMLVQELKVPFFPIAVEKSIGALEVDYQKTTIGYRDIIKEEHPRIKPVFGVSQSI